jgi:hypothetical protein
MQKKFSAYLSIYDDWDILPTALRSIADHIDELVVVDGGYEWMVPFLQATGRDPQKSDLRVYDAIASCGIRARFISRIWKNELEKRMAGYAACQNRYVYRIDADEIIFFDDSTLERFLSDNGAVAEMDMPMMIAPGWMACTTPVSRQAFLFDRQQVETDIHLNYLWLDLRADALPRAAARPCQVSSEPIAFNAHLSEWRHWETAINRAAFYELNGMRGKGVPWLTEFSNKPLYDFNRFFDVVEPKVYLETILNDYCVIPGSMIRPGQKVVPVPLTADQQTSFAPVYHRLLSGFAQLNRQLIERERHFVMGDNGTTSILLDLTSPHARAAIAPEGKLTIEVSNPIESAKVRLKQVLSDPPWQHTEPLSHTFDDRDLIIHLPEFDLLKQNVLRQAVYFQIWLDAPSVIQQFKIRPR